MVHFSFLRKYIVSEGDDSEELKHCLYPLTSTDIRAVESAIVIPSELREFYESIGYGFFHKQERIAFNRLLDPYSFKEVNLKEGIYEFDPNIEIYSDLYQGEKLLFFEINEGVYLSIDKKDYNSRNAVYYEVVYSYEKQKAKAVTWG